MTDDYLDGFMGGFEFVLLAMHGRMAELDDETQRKLKSFLEDYERVVKGYRARTPAPEKGLRFAPLVLAGPTTQRN